MAAAAVGRSGKRPAAVAADIAVPSSTASSSAGLRDRAAGGVGVELHQQRVLGVAAGEVEVVDRVALGVQRIEDVAGAERDRDRGAVVEAGERIEARRRGSGR